MLRRVEKEWGHEEYLIDRVGYYCLKRMVLKPGFHSSLHRHDATEESWYVERGEVIVDWSQDVAPLLLMQILLEEGDTLTIEPGMWHSFGTRRRGGACFLEVSTIDGATNTERWPKILSGPYEASE